jgi:hypothetical protein
MTAKEILDFVEYVDSFYNPVTGIYPIGGASVAVITKAIEDYIDSLDRAEAWGGGDSVDREFVRDIILAKVAA